jgi:hypothetical protein
MLDAPNKPRKAPDHEAWSIVPDALEALLWSLPDRATNRYVVDALIKSTGLPAKRITRVLGRIVATHSQARHDGEEFVYMGKPARRWTWVPYEEGKV